MFRYDSISVSTHVQGRYKTAIHLFTRATTRAFNVLTAIQDCMGWKSDAEGVSGIIYTECTSSSIDGRSLCFTYDIGAKVCL